MKKRFKQNKKNVSSSSCSQVFTQFLDGENYLDFYLCNLTLEHNYRNSAAICISRLLICWEKSNYQSKVLHVGPVHSTLRVEHWSAVTRPARVQRNSCLTAQNTIWVNEHRTMTGYVWTLLHVGGLWDPVSLDFKRAKWKGFLVDVKERNTENKYRKL